MLFFGGAVSSFLARESRKHQRFAMLGTIPVLNMWLLPEEFLEKVMETADLIDYKYNGNDYRLGKILIPLN